MEVRLHPDIQAKLSRLADARGSDAEILAREAIERFVDYDEWFIREVESGLAQIDQREVVSHEEVGARPQPVRAQENSPWREPWENRQEV